MNHPGHTQRATNHSQVRAHREVVVDNQFCHHNLRPTSAMGTTVPTSTLKAPTSSRSMGSHLQEHRPLQQLQAQNPEES